MRPAIRPFLLPALWFAVILVLTSVPAPILPHIPVSHADKMLHFAFYLPLGFLLARAFGGRGSRAVLYAAGLCLAAASCDELHQAFVPGRNADVLDLTADLAGSLTGAALWWVLRRKR